MTPLFKKLNFKSQNQILVLEAPGSFESELKEMKSYTDIVFDENKVSKIEFVIIFVTTIAGIEKNLEKVLPKLEADAIVWFCYPKGTSKKYKCEFNRDNGWAILGKHNFEGVRMVAIDEDWSALRFRQVEYIKSFTRNEQMILSESGKNRFNKKDQQK